MASRARFGCSARLARYAPVALLVAVLQLTGCAYCRLPRIDPTGELGVRKHFESPYRPGKKIKIDEYYRWIFENSVPGLPEKAKKAGLSPLEFMRRNGAFAVKNNLYDQHESRVSEADL